MTDEEKKEFEEFLQWKAERAKKDESKTETDNSHNSDVTSNPTVSNISSESKVIESNKDHNNTGLIILCVFVAFILLGIVVVGLSSKSGEHVTEALAEDSVANLTKQSQPIVNEKQDSIARAERIATVKKTIKIKSAYLGTPNSASGVDAFFYYKNVSDKTIKYLIWTGYPINAVDDRVDCEIRGYADYRGKDTGPIKPGKSSGGCWSCAWYNWTAKKLIITCIEIEYMDGSTFTINEDEIKYIR